MVGDSVVCLKALGERLRLSRGQCLIRLSLSYSLLLISLLSYLHLRQRGLPLSLRGLLVQVSFPLMAVAVARLLLFSMPAYGRWLSRAKLRVPRAVALILAVFVVNSLAVGLVRYANFAEDGDTPIFEQSLWTTLHGQMLSTTIEKTPDGAGYARQSHLGTHSSLIMLPLSLIYGAFPHPVTLRLIAVLAVAISAIPLYLLARDVLDPLAGLFLMAAYLFYPSVLSQTINDVHETTFFALPFLAAMLAYQREKFRQFFFWLCLALSVGEMTALLCASVGLVALFQRRTLRWILSPLLAGVGWLLFSVHFLIPHFNSGAPPRVLGRLSAYGSNLPEIALFLLLHPLESAQRVIAGGGLTYLFDILRPIGVVPPLLSGSVILAFPNLALNLLAAPPTFRTPLWSYSFPVAVALFVALVFGIARLAGLAEKYGGSRGAIAMTGALLVACSAFVNTASFPHLWCFPAELAAKESRGVMMECVELVQPGDSVTAPLPMMDHLARRSELHYYEDRHDSDVIILIKRPLPHWNERRGQAAAQLLAELPDSAGHRLLMDKGEFCVYKKVQ
jgi:uncharacterized membrane protein